MELTDERAFSQCQLAEPCLGLFGVMRPNNIQGNIRMDTRLVTVHIHGDFIALLQPRHHTTGTMIWYPTQSHSPDCESFNYPGNAVRWATALTNSNFCKFVGRGGGGVKNGNHERVCWPLFNRRSLMSSLYPRPPVYVSLCLRGQCRLVHTSTRDCQSF